jgi:hypothetical protein
MEEKEVSLKELFQNIGDYSRVVWAKRWWLVISGLLFSIFGFYKSYTHKTEYNATLSYMIAEDESGSSMGGVSAILGQFGLPGGGSNYNYGKIIEISKSTKIIERVIFDSCVVNGKLDVIGNHVINIYGLKTNNSFTYFKHSSLFELDDTERALFKKVYYKIVGSEKITNSLLITEYNEDDKILSSTSTTYDEDLSIALLTSLYDELSVFYNFMSTGKQGETFVKLQNRVDSLQREIKLAAYGAAGAQDILGLVQNTERVPGVQQQRKAEMLYVLYGEALKSLETARLFQGNENSDFFLTINTPYKPLTKVESSIVKNSITYFLLGAVLLALCFIVQLFIKQNLA